MKHLISFLTLVLSFISVSGQQVLRESEQEARTESFPKQELLASQLPEKHNLWIFFLAGQSNMAGRGLVEPPDTLPDARILTISEKGQWILAKEPLHFYEPSLTGLDCGLSFSRELIKYLPDSVSVALIPCAVGGSSIQKWLGDSVFRNVQLLTNFRNKVNFAQRHGTVKGILWHQGEADAKSGLIPHYQQNLTQLIGEFRSTVGNSHLPFLMGELNSCSAPEYQSRKDSINRIMHEVAHHDQNAFVIDHFRSMQVSYALLTLLFHQHDILPQELKKASHYKFFLPKL